MPIARRDDDAPASAVGHVIDAAFAGHPPQSDAVPRRLFVPDRVVVQQAHGTPQRLRVRVGRSQVPVRWHPAKRPGPRAGRSTRPREQRVAGRLVRAYGIVSEPSSPTAPHLHVTLCLVREESRGVASALNKNRPRLSSESFERRKPHRRTTPPVATVATGTVATGRRVMTRRAAGEARIRIRGARCHAALAQTVPHRLAHLAVRARASTKAPVRIIIGHAHIDRRRRAPRWSAGGGPGSD